MTDRLDHMSACYIGNDDPEYLKAISMKIRAVSLAEDDTELAVVVVRLIELPILYKYSKKEPFPLLRAISIDRHLVNYQKFGFEENYEPFFLLERASYTEGAEPQLMELIGALPELGREMFEIEPAIMFYNEQNCFDGGVPRELQECAIKCPEHFFSVRFEDEDRIIAGEGIFKKLPKDQKQ